MNIPESIENYLAREYYAARPYDGTNEGIRLQADPDFIPTRSFFYARRDGSSSSIPIINDVLLEDLSYWEKGRSPVMLRPTIFNEIFASAADIIAMATGVLTPAGIVFSYELASRKVKLPTGLAVYMARLYEDGVYTGQSSGEKVAHLTAKSKNTFLNLNVAPESETDDLSMILASAADGTVCDSVFFAQRRGRCISAAVYGPHREEFAANPMQSIRTALNNVLPRYPGHEGPAHRYTM